MFDRTTFKIKTYKEASNNRSYWLSKKPIERLQAAWRLNCVAHNLDSSKIQKMDRSAFVIRKRD